MAPADTPVTPPDFVRWKQQKKKISVLTAYDFTTARLLDAAGVDCLLVGDTLGMGVQGGEATFAVTLAGVVARAARRALVVADLPFLTYHAGPEQAILSAGRFLKETRCQAVKL